MSVPGRAWRRGQAGRGLRRRGRWAAPAGAGARGSDRPTPHRPRTAGRGAPIPRASLAPGTGRTPAEHLPQPCQLHRRLLRWPGPAQLGVGSVPSRRPGAGVGAQRALSAATSPRRSLCGSCPAHRGWRPAPAWEQLLPASPATGTPAPGHSAQAAHARRAGELSLWLAGRDASQAASPRLAVGPPPRTGSRGMGGLFTGTPPCGWGVQSAHLGRALRSIWGHPIS